MYNTSNFREPSTNLTGIVRNAGFLLHELMSQFPVVVIVGARQTGKTTLATTLYPHFHYFDLEKNSHFQRITSDPELFFKQYDKEVILDEAQLSPELFLTLRGVIDANRQEKGRFILTGSSSPALKQQVSESLAGRLAIIELEGLKTNESAIKPLPALYQALCDGNLKDLPLPRDLHWNPLTQEEIHFNWFNGGYPEIHLHKEGEFISRWFSFYEDTYIHRDIAKLFPQLNQYHYQRFIKMLGHLSGTILNKSQIARDLEISESAIRSYLEIASGTFLWRQLESFGGNKRKAVVRMPRGHLRDSGLLHHLLKLPDLEALYAHPMVGRSFEGFVIEEILKGLSIACPNYEAYYYRTRNGAEVDLILEGPFGLVPIEIKYGTHTPPQKLVALRNFMDEYHLPFGILINQSDALTWITPRILQIPVRFV